VEIDVLEALENLVSLRDVPLIEPIVRLDRRARDAIELEERALQLARSDLYKSRHKRLLRLWLEPRGAYPSPGWRPDRREESRDGLQRPTTPIRLRCARAAHRRTDDGDPPRQAPRRLRHEPECGARGNRVDGPADRVGAREPRRHPRGQAHGRSQQRRRPFESQLL